MKYAIVIADGAADLPIPELDGRTPLEAAHTPNMDAVARRGRLGTARTTPPDWAAGSDVCTMDLLGYDPRKYHTGRAPLEAAALGVPMSAADWIFRVNLVTVGQAPGRTGDDPEVMIDHSAGAIGDADARALFAGLVDHWRREVPDLAAQLALTHGVSYRSVMVDSSGADYAGVRCTPPHDIPGRPWRDALPVAMRPASAGAAQRLALLIETSATFLASHPINRERLARGMRPASLAWPWGQGTRPAMPSFHERFGVRGAMITAVDLLAGIARLIGWERLDVPGVTSYHDTDYRAQGEHSCRALDHFDLVCCHVESPDEASHQGDWKTKVAAIEAIDQHVVGPILRKLESFGDAEKDAAATGWRLMVLPDHYTLVSTRRHDPTPVPFAMAGAWVRAVRTGAYTEANASDSDLHIEEGHELMEFFLYGGRPRARPGLRP